MSMPQQSQNSSRIAWKNASTNGVDVDGTNSSTGSSGRTPECR